MSLFVDTFLQQGGIAKFSSTSLKGKNLLLFGGFIQEFAKELDKMNVDLSSDSNAEIFLLHPLHFNPFPNITHFLYEVGCEEAVIALLAYTLCKNGLGTLESLENLDVGYFASECNLSEEELEIIAKCFKKGENSIVVGNDIKTHKRAENIAKILAFLSRIGVEIVFLESYKNQEVPLDSKGKIEELGDLESYDGLVVYLQENQKNDEKEIVLESSRQFCVAGKMQDNTTARVRFADSKREVAVKLECNAELKGMVGILWIPQESDLQNGFCYKLISKVA